MPPAFGPANAAAAANAEGLLGAFARRFTDVRRTPKFAAARQKLERYALTPSKVFADSAVWTSTGDSVRSLLIAGRFVEGQYVFDARASVALPSRVGDSRHFVRLRRLSDGDYEWATSVEHAVGTIGAGDAAAIFAAAIGASEGESERVLRDEYRSTFPRSAIALGRLFSLETLRPVVGADGATTVTLGIRLHPARLRATHPAFAHYLEKYVSTARYRFTLFDRGGVGWVDMVGRDDLLTVRFRAREGRLAPLGGPPRGLPDSLQLRVNILAKAKVFTVGVKDLVADFTVLRSEHERGWLVRFRREPEWRFPLAFNRLIGSALRRPFERGGSAVRIAIVDSAGAQTLITRRARLVVRESAIVRWLGGLGGTAMSDFAGRAEAEENRFTAEAFSALGEDVLAALRGRKGAAAGP